MITSILFMSVLLFQEPLIEYGKQEELKGVTKIYVYTGTELAIRQDIIKEISKKLPTLVITDKAVDAEIVLLFGTDSNTFLRNVYVTGSSNSTTTFGGTMATTTGQNSGTAQPRYQTVISGAGLVMKVLAADRV